MPLLHNMFFPVSFLSLTPPTFPHAFIPPSLSPIPGCIHVDKRFKEIKSQLERGEEVKGGLLTHMLIAKEMSVEEIYANVTEMLLAGVDTVCVYVLHLCVFKGIVHSLLHATVKSLGHDSTLFARLLLKYSANLAV